MDRRKLPNLVLALVIVAALFVGASGTTSAAVPGPEGAGSTSASVATLQGERVAAAAPTVPTDESKVPHYFGPNPNWALSPFTVPAVTVTINGDGLGATAVATVGANGAVTGITITNPGSGYTAATVAIGGAGSLATANAVVTPSGVVNAITLTAGGSGYKAPVVTISGGGPVGSPASVSASATDTWNVSAGSATGGSFTLTVDGTVSTAIPWNAAALAVQAAFPGGFVTSVTDTAGTGPWAITFAAVPTSVTIDPALLTQGVADASVSVSAATDTWNASAGSATGGSFTLTVDGTASTAIPWNAAALAVQAAFPLGFVTSVTDTAGTGPWAITFAVAPTSVTIDPALLTQGVADASIAAAPIHTYNASAGSATGGSFTLTVDGTVSTAIPWNAAALAVQGAFPLGFVTLVTDTAGTGPWAITFAAAPTSVTINPAGLTYPAGVGATASAFGGVENTIAIISGGTGYTNPTVEFDMPADPNGTIAQGIAILDGSGAVVGINVTAPGSGYATAPGVIVLNGTRYDPIACGAVAQALRAEMMQSNDQGRLAPESSAAVETDSAGITPAAPAAPAAMVAAADCGAVATTTLALQSITLDTFGANYTSAPAVTIADSNGGAGANATATATIDVGGVTAINLITAGSGYITPGGIKKFVDPLPGLCNPAVLGSCPATGKYIPLGVPAAKTYAGVQADEYEIGLVQYRTSFSSSLMNPLTGDPVGTLVRGYVQLETPANAAISQHFPLTNELLNGTKVPVLKSDGVTQWLAVTPPQWLGPTISATKDKPVRIIFRNLLPSGSGGDLILPTDSTLMGSGMGPAAMWNPLDQGTVTDGVRNPNCTQAPKPDECFKDNRATLHLHGGITPWISDGTPHQWITPADQTTPWPQGVSVSNVPDMAAAGCDGTTDGCMTFYYTNQQSARLMFYHDHAWGITRLNVYAGEAAGYLISDDTEKALLASGTIPADQIPLIIQDRTFVPQDTQLYNQYDGAGNVTSYGQDPTWDASRWGGYGNFWYHHVYMPAQNPGDPGGMSAYGRWMYGPWFWPPAGATTYGPIANPYYGKDPKGADGIRGTADDWGIPLAVACNLDVPSTWQYDTDPFCEPELIPGTPNISTGMEQFNDTPIVNGVAYPTITIEPKSYRFRMLNAANDRFFNFQWYVGDPTTASTGLNKHLDVNGNLAPEVIGATEVALNPLELAAAQTDPVVFPTPVQPAPAETCKPDWIQIGTEGGFLPAPAVVDGQQPTTWITDPTRFDVGNVDLHSMLLAPAERADVIVDFSKCAGKTLILYNDAPAAFPARVPSYDYYTGAPDLSPNGAPAILPGYGPNTRTVMQVKIAGSPAPAFNLTKLQTAFSHKANGTGVFESGQHPIIVGQAAYNSAYGTSFLAGSNCNVPINTPITGTPPQSCDGLVRVNDTALFGFNTLKAPTTRMVMPLQPKAIHDEMNSATFDEFGRMSANLGIEAQPPTPGVQNVTLYPYVNPQTELIDATNLPKNDVIFNATTGLPVSDVKITPIASATDGSQIWRITHNGVDTHPIHFHLYDVQVLNRVTWDNIIIPTERTELGWKDTVRTSPLEDTIVALRPIIPELPWELPNAIRNLSPMMPTGSTQSFNAIDPQGNPTPPIVNQLVNFGWEYVFHCHILSHEEMDMMRPVSVAMPPFKPDGLALNLTTGTLTWNDNSISETSFVVQRSTDGTTWFDLANIDSPLSQPNTRGPRSWFVGLIPFGPTSTYYRVIARNLVGSLAVGFSTVTAESISTVLAVHNHPMRSGYNSLTPDLNGAPTLPLAETVLLNTTFPPGSGGLAAELIRWNLGAWNIHYRGGANNFPLALGKGYRMRVTGSNVGTGYWREVGTPLVAAVPVSLLKGWNFIGLPFQPTPLSAESLLLGIALQGGACSQVDRWFNGAWNTHYLNGANNYTIARDQGYRLLCSKASTYTPN